MNCLRSLGAVSACDVPHRQKLHSLLLHLELIVLGPRPRLCLAHSPPPLLSSPRPTRRLFHSQPSQDTQTCSQSQTQCPEHIRAQTARASRPIRATRAKRAPKHAQAA